MQFHKPTSKVILSTSVLMLIGGGIGAGATYLSLRDNLLSSPPQSGNTPRPDGVAAPLQLESKIPEGTLSPTVVAASPDTYSGKEINVRGILLESVAGKFILVGQELDKPRSVTLDFTGTNIDPKPFIGAFTNDNEAAFSNKTTGPVTVTGIAQKDGLNVKLLVKSVQQ